MLNTAWHILYIQAWKAFNSLHHASSESQPETYLAKYLYLCQWLNLMLQGTASEDHAILANDMQAL